MFVENCSALICIHATRELTLIKSFPNPHVNGGYDYFRSWHGESLLAEMEAGGGGNLTISCPLSAGRCYFASTVVGWIMYRYLKKKLFVDQLWFSKCWCWHLRDFARQVVADVTWAKLEYSCEYSWVNWFLTILDNYMKFIYLHCSEETNVRDPRS